MNFLKLVIKTCVHFQLQFNIVIVLTLRNCSLPIQSKHFRTVLFLSRQTIKVGSLTVKSNMSEWQSGSRHSVITVGNTLSTKAIQKSENNAKKNVLVRCKRRRSTPSMKYQLNFNKLDHCRHKLLHRKPQDTSSKTNSTYKISRISNRILSPSEVVS